MTAPDRQIVREIAREAAVLAARRRDYIGSAITNHDVMAEILASGDRAAYGRLRDAVVEEHAAAIITATWPDEQPAAEQVAPERAGVEAAAVLRLRAWRDFSARNRPGYDHLRDVSYDKAPICDADLDAVLALLDDHQERLTTECDKARIDAAELLDALETTSDDADRIADQRSDYREEIMRLRGELERLGRVERELRRTRRLAYRSGWDDRGADGIAAMQRGGFHKAEAAAKAYADRAEAADLAARAEREAGR